MYCDVYCEQMVAHTTHLAEDGPVVTLTVHTEPHNLDRPQLRINNAFGYTHRIKLSCKCNIKKHINIDLCVWSNANPLHYYTLRAPCTADRWR